MELEGHLKLSSLQSLQDKLKLNFKLSLAFKVRLCDLDLIETFKDG